MQRIGDGIGMATDPLNGGFAGQHAQQAQKRDDRRRRGADRNQPVNHPDPQAGQGRDQIGLPGHGMSPLFTESGCFCVGWIDVGGSRSAPVCDALQICRCDIVTTEESCGYSLAELNYCLDRPDADAPIAVFECPARL